MFERAVNCLKILYNTLCNKCTVTTWDLRHENEEE